MGSRRLAGVVAAAGAALSAVACSTGTVVNTGESWVPTGPPAPATPPPGSASNANLVNAFDYFGRDGYFFTTPSGRWRCAIVAHSKAGCQSATGSRLGIAGEPSNGPNAIVVETQGDAHFVPVDSAGLSLAGNQAKPLQFNKILAAAGFRCDVGAAGVSCLSEVSGNGFTFSGDGYTLRYTDVPAG